MIYNILIINKSENLTQFRDTLNKIEPKEIFSTTNPKSIRSLLSTKSIHIIIVNPKDISIKELNTILTTSQSLNQHIPILAIGNHDDISFHEADLIYDFIDIK